MFQYLFFIYSAFEHVNLLGLRYSYNVPFSTRHFLVITISVSISLLCRMETGMGCSGKHEREGGCGDGEGGGVVAA